MSNKTVVCVFRSGGPFEMEDVSLLRTALWQNMPKPFRFICLTDTVPHRKGWRGQRIYNVMEPLRKAYPGCWSKMELYAPYMEQYKPFLYIDLDTAVVGSLKDFMDREFMGDRFVTLRDFHHPERKGASGLMYFPQGHRPRFRKVWDAFTDTPFKIMKRYGKFQDDGGFTFDITSPDAHFQDIFDDDRIVSFKPTRRTFTKELNDETSLVCFHGQPKIRDAAELEGFDWVTRYVEIGKGTIVSHMPGLFKTGVYPPYMKAHHGTLIVAGSGPNMEEEVYKVRKTRGDIVPLMAIGHAAGFIKAEFVVSDHYEVHKKLKELQSEFHSNFTTHCSRSSDIDTHPVDHWWDMTRATCSSVQTAIRIGLRMGFDEIILCGCPMKAGRIRHPDQREKDKAKMWPPNRDIEKYGEREGWNKSAQILDKFQTGFREWATTTPEVKNKVRSMSGFTRDVLGAPDFVVKKKGRRESVTD